MSYIGNTVENQNYVPAIDYFNGDGSTVAFTLSRPVASVAAVQAVISNVPQNPGSAFTVSGSTITFTSAPPSGTANIYVYYTSPNTQVVQPGQGTVYSSSLSTGGPTWDASGNLGVGVTPSAWSALTAVQVKNASLAGFQNNSYLSANAYYDGSVRRYISTGYATDFRSASGNFQWHIAPSGTAGDTVSYTQVLSVSKDAPLVLQGGVTNATGTGITFPATQSASSDANTLDDYEEGTWTPTATAATGAITTYTSGARYTKIGRLVNVVGYVSISNGGTAANSLIVTNLPFNCASTSAQAMGLSRDSGLTGAVYSTFALDGTASIYIQSTSGSGASFSNGVYYNFNVTYITST